MTAGSKWQTAQPVDFSDVHYLITVIFRSTERCAVKSCTYLAGESPAPEGAASATG